MTKEELEKDEAGIIAQLQQLQGMLTYVRAKLKALDDAAEKSTKKTPKEA